MRTLTTITCLLALALATTALAACGGDDDSPADKCRDFVSDLCSRAIECVAPGESHSDCVAEISDAFACGDVGKVSDTYDECVDDLNSATCDVLFQPNPDSGQPEIVVPQNCFNIFQPGE